MRIRHHSKGKFHLIECPDGTRVVRPRRQVSQDHLVVPFEGEEITIPADLDELLPMLAESGLCDLTLVGEPVPDVYLAGVICPKCGEDDPTLDSRHGTLRGRGVRTHGADIVSGKHRRFRGANKAAS